MILKKIQRYQRHDDKTSNAKRILFTSHSLAKNLRETLRKS